MSVTISIWSSIKGFMRAHINLSRLTFVSSLPQLLYFKSAECHFFSVGRKRFSLDLAVLWSYYEVILNSFVTKIKHFSGALLFSLILSCLTGWSPAPCFLSTSCCKEQTIARTESSIENILLHLGTASQSSRNTSSQTLSRERVQPHLQYRAPEALSSTVWGKSRCFVSIRRPGP